MKAGRPIRRVPILLPSVDVLGHFVKHVMGLDTFFPKGWVTDLDFQSDELDIHP